MTVYSYYNSYLFISQRKQINEVVNTIKHSFDTHNESCVLPSGKENILFTFSINSKEKINKIYE